ncbi:MAG: DNA-binding protein [Bacteroidetes bacterium]|nr:MAG: DNA-binding protein [Bacteroidota bacterium]
MVKGLTNSSLDRQNILNNKYALQEIQKAVGIQGIVFENEFKFLKSQISDFFEIDERTIERYLRKYGNELKQNGYEILKGKRLKDFKLKIINKHVTDMNVGNMNKNEETNVPFKTPRLGIFNFKSLLNLAMLLVESNKARLLRTAMLDIVIDTINQRTKGKTKYINQRDEDFIESYFIEEIYRKEFTDALHKYVDMGVFKYPIYTDKIYVSIFKERASEYRKVLKLESRDIVRETFYSEVLDLISSYEYGFAKELETAYNRIGRKLTAIETDKIFSTFENQALWKPLIEKARNKMASRDLAFRDALHLKLQKYISPLKAEDYERFIGEKSKEIEERLKDAKDVFKRLKERE